MLVDERRRKVLELAESEGFVSLRLLSERIGASESTLRRDLEHLDGLGQLRRTRGGAAYAGESLTPFEARVDRAAPEKRRIAAFVADLVRTGDSVLLDGGTTTLEVARRLGADDGKAVQVVTNSIPVANLLAGKAHVELVLIGGYVYPKTGVALGPLAVAALGGIRVNRLVMSVGGITADGLFNANALLVETERAMAAAADEVLVACDAGKLGVTALVPLGPLSMVDRLVTDRSLTDGWRNTLRDAGLEVHTV